MKLRSAQDPRRDRAGERRLLVGDLRRGVAAGEPVDSDDGDDDDAPHAGSLADTLQVPRRGGEELCSRLLVGRGPGGHVDDGFDPVQRFGEAITGYHVDAAGTRHRNDAVAPFREHVDYVAADPPGRARYRDCSACFHDLSPLSIVS